MSPFVFSECRRCAAESGRMWPKPLRCGFQGPVPVYFGARPSAVSMLPFKLVCARTFYLPIGKSVFPVSKYRLMCEHLLKKGIARPEDFVEPAPASDEGVLLVHTPKYVHKLRTGTVSESEARQLEVPYSRELVEAYWLCVGGTILAADCALRDGVAFNIGGGFHHAFPDHGEGFNLINDVAVAIRRMQKDGKIKTAMTVDCDVHDGNGTAAIFGIQNAAGIHLRLAEHGSRVLPVAPHQACAYNLGSTSIAGIKNEGSYLYGLTTNWINVKSLGSTDFSGNIVARAVEEGMYLTFPQ